MSEVPHFEPDETETAYLEERAKQRRERRRFARWEDRYWLSRFLTHIGYWAEGIDGYWVQSKYHEGSPGRKLPQELKYEHWRQRATDRWPRYDRMIYQYEQRHTNRIARQRERIELRRQRR